MNWSKFLQNFFYIVGIIFFIIIITAAIIFMWKTTQTANAIKKVISSAEIEDILMRVKEGVIPLLQRI